MKPLTISHISHGISETGGFKHEQFLLDKLSEHFNTNGQSVIKNTIRANRYFKGIAHLNLLWWSFVKSSADINIVVARTALSAILRNCFNNKKILIVLHYFDERDRKKIFLKWYYHVLFLVLSNIKFSNVAIVTVAPFWKDYFDKAVDKNIPVFYFPNFFKTSFYEKFIHPHKEKKINLGQFSWKNDARIFDLANQLSLIGYDCYFSTMIENEVGKFNGYEVKFENKETYLSNMASSLYTIAFIGINEGWNRLAHESILVGTTVIGNEAGGLGDLLKESSSLIANDVEQFIQLISGNNHSTIEKNFIKKYDEQQAAVFLSPIIDFLNTRS